MIYWKMTKGRKNRKAQIKMFETIAVLVIFFFLIVFGVSFYFVMQRSSYNRQVERNAQLVSVQLAQKISDIPELDCALAGIQIDNCVDKIKLEMFNEKLKEGLSRVNYFRVLGYSKIAINEVYPTDKVHELYENEPQDYIGAYKNWLPVLLYDAVENTFSFAVMEITTYAQG